MAKKKTKKPAKKAAKAPKRKAAVKAKSASKAKKSAAPKKAAKKASAPKKTAAPKKTKLETISFAELAQMKLNNDLSGVNANHGPDLHKHKNKTKNAAAPGTDANLRAKTSITGRKGTIAQPGRDDIGNRGH